MTIETIIEKLNEVIDNPEGKVDLFFTQKKTNGRYISYKPRTEIVLKKELVGIVMEALEEVKGKSVVTFNPTGSLDDTLEECSYDSVTSLVDIEDSLETANLLEDPPNDISKFTFYCLVVQLDDNEKILFFRRLTKFKRLQKGIVGQFVTGEFQKVSAELLGIDSYVDIIGYNSTLTVTNHIAMERIFDIKTQYQESAQRTLEMIKEADRIENFSQFETDSINDGRIIRGLTKLLKDPEKVRNCFENFDKVKELVAEVELAITFTEDGEKLVYEGKEQLQAITLILRDAYYQAYISERLGVDELA